MSKDEQAIEAEIQAKGLNAPRGLGTLSAARQDRRRDYSTMNLPLKVLFVKP
jgi:hypothetical protein